MSLVVLPQAYHVSETLSTIKGRPQHLLGMLFSQVTTQHRLPERLTHIRQLL